MKDFAFRLKQIHGKPYGQYKTLLDQDWRFGDFRLRFLHVQGDPHASPSRLQLSITASRLGMPRGLCSDPDRRRALADFLLRRLSARSQEGPLGVVQPSAEVFVRNSAHFVGDPMDPVLNILTRVELPGDGRRIDGEQATSILVSQMMDWATDSLYWMNVDEARCLEHMDCVQLQCELRAQLAQHDLVAFVANGSILPRASGLSEQPLQGAKPFVSPPEWQVELTAMGRTYVGMGIPKGITLIAGGAYHGKSTLLKALGQAAYDHIPGDGRELIVCDPSAFLVRTEEGRPVHGTRLSPLVRRLPGDVDTEQFQTTNASGSTSQASNLLEALEIGSNTLLIDEDASAVNFLIRDQRMRELVGDPSEPLVPLVDRAREICSTLDKSIVMVAGACGDWLAVADNVLVMENFQPVVATERARAIVPLANVTIREDLPALATAPLRDTSELLAHLRPRLKPASAVEKQVKVKLQGEHRLVVGRLVAEVSRLDLMRNAEQARACGAILLGVLQEEWTVPMDQMLTMALARAESRGLVDLPGCHGQDLCLPRLQELGAVLLRLQPNRK